MNIDTLKAHHHESSIDHRQKIRQQTSSSQNRGASCKSDHQWQSDPHKLAPLAMTSIQIQGDAPFLGAITSTQQGTVTVIVQLHQPLCWEESTSENGGVCQSLRITSVGIRLINCLRCWKNVDTMSHWRGGTCFPNVQLGCMSLLACRRCHWRKGILIYSTSAGVMPSPSIANIL